MSSSFTSTWLLLLQRRTLSSSSSSSSRWYHHRQHSHVRSSSSSSSSSLWRSTCHGSDRLSGTSSVRNFHAVAMAASATDGNGGGGGGTQHMPWMTIALSSIASVIGSTTLVDTFQPSSSSSSITTPSDDAFLAVEQQQQQQLKHNGGVRIGTEQQSQSSSSPRVRLRRYTVTPKSVIPMTSCSSSSSLLLGGGDNDMENSADHAYEIVMNRHRRDTLFRSSFHHPQHSQHSQEEEETTTTNEHYHHHPLISSYDSKPYDISISAMQGMRMTMEDEYIMKDGGRFIGVFDGHGGNGVSRYLKQNLYKRLLYHIQYKQWELHDHEDDDDDDDVTTVSSSTSSPSSSPSVAATSSSSDHTTSSSKASSSSSSTPSLSCQVQALRSAFADIEKEVMADDYLRHQGSTAIAILLHESNIDNNSTNEQQETANSKTSKRRQRRRRTILSANVGDSRAVLSRQGRAVELTRDHKPNEEREKQRILAMGESIEYDRYARVHRVKSLSLSRAIGDYWAKPIVSSEVEIQHYPLLESSSIEVEEKQTVRDDHTDDQDDDQHGCGYGDQFIVVATDGLWDVMTSQDVVSFVHDVMATELHRYRMENKNDVEYYHNYQRILRKNMAKFITREAISRGTGDNVCVVMVWLNDNDHENEDNTDHDET